uniref:FP protein C-terminal domain-containing protein n=1 Tax=Cacopsylla melanoneura TaxID=428564 RepID=A0A8D9EYV8_9HEMI
MTEEQIKEMEKRLMKAMEKVVQNTMRQEMETLKKELEEQRKKVDKLEKCNYELSKNVNDLQQYIRRENVLITNYPQQPNENIERIVCKLGESIGVKIDFKQDIQAAHRNPSRAAVQPILIRFVNRQIRNKFAQAGREKKLRISENKLYFNDHLTPTNSKLFFEARKLYKTKKIKGAWTSNGTVLVRRDENSQPIKIHHMDDLKPFQVSYSAAIST